jgi:predicted GIY-YIG superfamily endonuclease
MAFCYILRCCDGSYYVGSTHDIATRLTKHNDGSASVYTAPRRPVALVFSETFESIDAARAREQQIKGWTRAKKEALIASDRVILRLLSRSSGA